MKLDVQKMSLTRSMDHDMSHVLGFESELMQIKNKTISDGGITVDFWIIKVHTSN